MQQSEIIQEIEDLKAQQAEILDKLDAVMNHFKVGKSPKKSSRDNDDFAEKTIIKLSEKRRGRKKNR